MSEDSDARPISVIGPDGEILTRATLPLPDIRRWGIYSKAQIVVAVDRGLLAFDEACQIYGLSPEELEHWRERYHSEGKAGLRVTHTQKYRKSE